MDDQQNTFDISTERMAVPEIQIGTGPFNALLNSSRETRWGKVPDPIAENIASSVSFDALEKTLLDFGIYGLKPLSGGTFSVVLDAGDNVLRIGFGALLERPQIPEILQPIRSGMVGGLRFEIFPKADTDSVVDADLVEINQSLAEKGYQWGDSGLDNIGKVHGKIVVIDSDGISQLAGIKNRILGRQYYVHMSNLTSEISEQCREISCVDERPHLSF